MKSIFLSVAAVWFLPLAAFCAEVPAEATPKKAVGYTVFAPEGMGLASSRGQRGDERMRVGLFSRDQNLGLTPEEVRELMGLPGIPIPRLASGPARTTEERLEILRLMRLGASRPLPRGVIVEALGEPHRVSEAGTMIYFNDHSGSKSIAQLLTDPLSPAPTWDMVVIWMSEGLVSQTARVDIPAGSPLVYAEPWKLLEHDWQIKERAAEEVP